MMTTSNEHNNAPAVPQGEPVAWMVYGNYTRQPFGMLSSAEAYMRGLLKSDPDGGYHIRPLRYATTAPAPAQEVTLSLAAEDVHAAFAKNFPKSRISQAWINFAADIAQAIAARAAKPAQEVGLTDEDVNAAAKVLAERFDYSWEHMPEEGRKNMRVQARAVVEAALRAKGGKHV